MLQTKEPSSKVFFDQLYSAARLSARNEQTMDRMKRLMVFICYLLASLNNTKINSFKFDITFYLDSADTNNEGINTMANLGATTTSEAVYKCSLCIIQRFFHKCSLHNSKCKTSLNASWFSVPNMEPTAVAKWNLYFLSRLHWYKYKSRGLYIHYQMYTTYLKIY